MKLNKNDFFTENAVSAGFDGMIILDNMNETAVTVITGTHKNKLNVS